MDEILQSSSPKKDYYKVIIILLWAEACAQRPDWPIDASNTWDTMKLQPVGRVIQWLSHLLSQSVINLWVSEWGCWYYTSKNPLNRPTLAIRLRLILWQEFLRHTYTTKNKFEIRTGPRLLSTRSEHLMTKVRVSKSLFICFGWTIYCFKEGHSPFSVFAYISRPWAVIHRAPRNRYWLNTGIKKTSAPIGALDI